MNSKLQIFLNFFIRNNKLKTYFFFFAISSLLWLFSNFSQRYNYTLAIPVVYTNIPEGIYAENLPKDTIYVETMVSGYQILKYRFLKPTFLFNVKKENISENSWWRTDRFFRDLNTIIGTDNQVININPEKIKFAINKIHKKEVKILPKISINYKEGYKNNGDIKTTPESIWIFGQKDMLDTIRFVQTKPIKLKDVSKDIDIAVNLQLPKNIHSNVKKATLHINVDQFVESHVDVPCKVANVPDSLKVVLFPKHAIVRYKLFQSDYKTYTPDDFNLIADFVKSDSTMTLILDKKPIKIFDVKIKPEKVAFLIKEMK